jgi:hypothetical protein
MVSCLWLLFSYLRIKTAKNRRKLIIYYSLECPCLNWHKIVLAWFNGRSASYCMASFKQPSSCCTCYRVICYEPSRFKQPSLCFSTIWSYYARVRIDKYIWTLGTDAGWVHHRRRINAAVSSPVLVDWYFPLKYNCTRNWGYIDSFQDGNVCELPLQVHWFIE